MALGLKCGGTLEERASRLFSTKGKGLNELDPTLFAKSKGKASTAHRSAKELEKNREIAAMEAQVYRFAEILSEQRAATKENVERKQARTELEREDSDEDESGKIFSLKYFLRWMVEISQIVSKKAKITTLFFMKNSNTNNIILGFSF